MKTIFSLWILILAIAYTATAQQDIATIYLQNSRPAKIKHNKHWNIANYDTLVVFCKEHLLFSETAILNMLKDSFSIITNNEVLIARAYRDEMIRLIDTTLNEMIVYKTNSLSNLQSVRFQYNNYSNNFGDGVLKINLSDTTISDSIRSILFLFRDCVSKVLSEKWKPYRDSIYQSITNSYLLWSTFITQGFFQYPWESLVNGWYYKPTIQSPPRSQWILIHPSLGIQFQNIIQNPIKEVLSIDLIGKVYYSKNFTNHYQIALASYFRNDIGAGAGIKIGWNSFSFGIAFHDVDEKNGLLNDAPFYFMTVNLFNLSQSKVTKYDQYKNDMQSKITNKL